MKSQYNDKKWKKKIKKPEKVDRLCEMSGFWSDVATKKTEGDKKTKRRRQKKQEQGDKKTRRRQKNSGWRQKKQLAHNHT